MKYTYGETQQWKNGLKKTAGFENIAKKTKPKPVKRPAIYGWDNSRVEAKYLNKLSTPIRNQRDYDQMKEKEFGMTKAEYQRANNIMHIPTSTYFKKK